MNYLKKIIPHYIIAVFLLFFNAIMIIFAKEIFFGAQKGLELWLKSVVPSLFPFMISVSFMVNMGVPRKLGAVLQPFSLKLFNLTGTQAFIFLTGITAGCPIGLKTLAELYRSGSISKSAAHRLMLYCNNTGIMFMLSTVGTAFLGSESAGRRLVLCNLSAVLTLAVLSGIFSARQSPEPRIQAVNSADISVFSKTVISSVRSILTVGAYIIIFSVISEIFKILHIYDGLAAMLTPLGIEKKLARAAAIGILEVTNGCSAAAGSTKACFVTCAALCGWGGLSIHAQSTEFLNGTDLSPAPYYTGKMLTSALCAFYAFFIYS